MPWTAKFEERLRAIEVLSQGPVTPEDLRQQTLETLALGRAHQTDRFLIDDAGIRTAFSVFDLIAMVDSYQALGMPLTSKTAVVLPTSPDSARTVWFYETVARNRIYNVRVFRDRSSAEAWLLEYPAVPA